MSAQSTFVPISKSPAGSEESDRASLTRRLLDESTRASEPERRRLEDEVIVLNTKLAESIARKYVRRSEDYPDVTQVAYVGLVNAVRRFSPEKGADFVSFALPTIAGEIKRFFRDQGWTIRPPRRIQDLHRQLATATSDLSQAKGRTPTTGELADELGEDPGDVDEALACHTCYTPLSIDAPTRVADGTALSDLLGESDGDFDRSEAATVLGPLCRDLPGRDKQILFLRFFRGWSQQEIADELGVTQMQVSRLLTRILGQLRSQLGPIDDDAGDAVADDESAGS